MTTVKKYPTSFTNPDGWLTPANADGVEDNLCAAKLLALSGSATLYLSGYGFALPANAIIDFVYLNHKGVIEATNFNQQLFFTIHNNVNSREQTDGNSPIQGVGPCSSTVFGSDVDAQSTCLFDVATLNSENFKTYVIASQIVTAPAVYRVDAAYVKVVYHLPVVKKGMMDGFIFVS